MKILVTGGTGNVGGAVVTELLRRGAEVRVLARKQPEAGKLPVGVEVAIGDLLDPVSVEQAMQGVDKLFLLNAVVTDELTQALIAYGIAKRVGLKHVTYLSVFKVGPIPRCAALCIQVGSRERAARVRCSVYHSASRLLHSERREFEGRSYGARSLSDAGR